MSVQRRPPGRGMGMPRAAKEASLSLPRLTRGPAAFILAVGCCSWAVAGDLPEIKKDCPRCHVVSDGALTGRLLQPVTRLCLGCHPERAGAREHVVGIAPSLTVTSLPLQDGKITCATCHDPHVNPYGNLLRLKPNELCRACHNK